MTHQTAPTQRTRRAPRGALRPGTSAYTASVTTLTGVGTPDLVMRPETAQQVAEAVRYARAHHLSVTVRSGGHSLAGLSTAPDGLLLDLRAMDQVVVDPITRLVRVGGGARWGQVADALRPHHLGITSGDTASVGVGGLTLGGGIGWMVRRHGLAIDQLVSAQIVTADGRVREVSARRHAGLFWALRGGGSGFGVVTRFDLMAKPVGDVVFGRLTLPLDDPAPLLTGWRDVQIGADERLTTTLTLVPAMSGRPALAMIGLCFAGPEADVDAPLERLRALGQVLSDDVSLRPYAGILEDEEPPAGGMRLGMHNALLPDLSDAVLRDVAALTDSPPTMVSLRGLGGAFSRVPEGTTAFPSRAAEALVIAMRIAPGADDSALAEPPGWDRVARHGTGVYGNFRSQPAPALDLSATGRRLAGLRATYDPNGMFGRVEGTPLGGVS